jgi:hypothetical protein
MDIANRRPYSMIALSPAPVLTAGRGRLMNFPKTVGDLFPRALGCLRGGRLQII